MADKIEDGGPAFPVLEAITHSGNARSSGGMSLRDYFAGQALNSGIIDGHGLNDRQLTELFGPNKTNIRQEEIAAAIAYRVADAMLKASKGEL